MQCTPIHSGISENERTGQLPIAAHQVGIPEQLSLTKTDIRYFLRPVRNAVTEMHSFNDRIRESLLYTVHPELSWLEVA